MSAPRALLVVLLAVGLVVPTGAGAAIATGAATAAGPAPDATTGVATASATAPDENASDNASVDVGVGQQLSTVIEAAETEVDAEVENAVFEARYERDGEGDRAEAIADRAEALRERAREVREDYREATRAFERGEISRSEYARRVAVLNARAENLLESYRQLREHAETVSTFELRAAGLNRTELRRAIEDVENVTGAGPAALLERFTGLRTGEVELRTDGGLSVEVESEDGERSREIRRDAARDEDDSFTVAQADALETARGILSEQDGRWVLVKASVHEEDGFYKFEFVLRGNESGEAEVRVDGSTGEVFRLEEEIEPLEDEAELEDEDEREIRRPRDDDDSITVNESDALEAARAELSDRDGTWVLVESSVEEEEGFFKFEFVLRGNASGEAEVRVDGSTGEVFRLEEEVGPDEGEDDQEVEDEQEDEDEVEDEVDELAMVIVDGTPARGATITVRVTADGEPVANATVTVNGQDVGETGADGTLQLTLPDAKDVDVTAAAGGETAELEFEFEREDEDDVIRDLDASASLDDGTVTVAVRFNGSGVENVTVFANDRRVGTTDADGTLAFETAATEELELELVKGELEIELEYRIVDGSLVLEEAAHEGDGDKVEDEDEREDDEREDELDDLELSVVDGEPARNATITVRLTAASGPVANATVEVNGEPAGTTDENGTLQLTLPDAKDVRVTAAAGGETAHLQFEFEREDEQEDEQEDEDEIQTLDISVVEGEPARNATITVKVTSNGEPVEGATVEVDSDVVGETGADGTIRVTLPDDDDARVEAEKGDARARIEFEFDEN